MQRREHGRYRLWFPLEVRAQEIDGMAVNHNISAGGMLIAVSARLEPGAPVTVSFRMPPDVQTEHVVTGRVVRIEDNSEDPDGMWPYRMAVAFDEVEERLVPFLEKAAQAL